MLVYTCTCTYTQRCTNPNQAILWALRFGPPAQTHTQKEQKHDCISLVSNPNRSSAAKMRKPLILEWRACVTHQEDSSWSLTSTWTQLSGCTQQIDFQMFCLAFVLSYRLRHAHHAELWCKTYCTQATWRRSASLRTVAVKGQVWLDISTPNMCRLPCTRRPS